MAGMGCTQQLAINSLLHLCKNIRYRKYDSFCRFFSFFFCFFSVFFSLIIFLLFMTTSDKSCCSANFFALFRVSSGNNLSMRNFKGKGFLRILKLIIKIPNNLYIFGFNFSAFLSNGSTCSGTSGSSCNSLIHIVISMAGSGPLVTQSLRL